jgi:hypothetical protein
MEQSTKSQYIRALVDRGNPSDRICLALKHPMQVSLLLADKKVGTGLGRHGLIVRSHLGGLNRRLPKPELTFRSVRSLQKCHL